MSGPPQRTFSFDRDDEHALRPGANGFQAAQPYSHQPQVSPIEPHAPQFPSSYDAPPPPPAHRNPVGAHPGNSYDGMQAQRQYNISPANSNSNSPVSPPPAAQLGSFSRTNTTPRRPLSQTSPPPVYAGAAGTTPNGPVGRRESDTTPGQDNLSNAAVGGGIPGIAMGVANANERESGVQALRDINNWGRNGNGVAGVSNIPRERNSLNSSSSSLPYGYPPPDAATRRPIQPQSSYSSTQPLAGAAYAPGIGSGSEHSSARSLTLNDRPPSNYAHGYHDSPYNRYSSSNLDLMPAMTNINPNDILDDPDDEFVRQTPAPSRRKSLLPFGGSRNGSREGSTAAAAVGAGAATGATAGALAEHGSRDASGNYQAVSQSGANASSNEFANAGTTEKTWGQRPRGKKRRLWLIGTLLVVIVLAAILGGVLGGVLNQGHRDKSASGAAAVATDNKADLDKDSDEIKKLMGNTNLHKVFPGMDYTALNTQYPDCLTSPPSQNNVTRDIAVLSQLTDNVRLYGTDCNQTEMVLHSIDRLGLTSMKVWLGVWLGSNDTTNSRQIAQMWDILDKHGDDPFKGIIAGNEVLYRKDLTSDQLFDIIDDIKSNLTSKNIGLPIAVSDLGDNWTVDIAKKVDIVMSNIHPFFAGVTAEAAAGWTWNFWQQHDVELTASNKSIKHIISEVGWPSAGGNDCGAADCTSKTQGSIAGITEMNTFMSDFICQSIENGTEYFWFEAFDEPWKVQYNTDGKEWEDKWGLMDVDRNLKANVSIPDCGGKTPASS